MRARVRARTHTGARHCLRHHGPARLRKARDDVDGLRHLHHLRHTHARASVHIRRADGTGGKNRGTRRAHQTSLSCFTTSMPSSAAAGSVRTSAAQHAGQRGRGQRKHKANTNIQHHVHLPVAIAKTYLKSLNVLLPTSTMRPRKILTIKNGCCIEFGFVVSNKVVAALRRTTRRCAVPAAGKARP